MRRLWSLIPGSGADRRRTAVVVILVALAPVIVMLSLPSGGPRPPVALVNLDTPITDSGAPVAAGKLLTENLVSDDGDVDWVLTDAATAGKGLAAGSFLAVVTIPAGFSADVATLASSTPRQAGLTVQTSTQHGYLAGAVASALSANLPAGVSVQLTRQYVAGTLSALGSVGDGLQQAAAGAQAIASGNAQAADGAVALGDGAAQLGTGLADIAGVLADLPPGARGLGEAAAAGADDAAALAVRLAERSAQSVAVAAIQDDQNAALDALVAQIQSDPAAPVTSVAAQVEAIRQEGRDAASGLSGQAVALADDAAASAVLAVGSEAVALVSGPVADGLGDIARAASDAAGGADLIASGEGRLADGLRSLSDGSGTLASGLEQAAAAVPQYTAAEQQGIADVVADPIAVDATSTGGPGPAASEVAALAALALWIGAIATFLLLGAFPRAALTSSAPSWRIAAAGAGPVVLLALAQAVLVWAVLAASGAAPTRLLAAAATAAVAAVSFGLIHQALVAFLPRAGLMVSLVLVGVQAAAAGTLWPAALGPVAAGPLSMLPLSLALQAAQALVGGSLHAVLAALLALTAWAVAAALATVVAVRRGRERATSRIVVRGA